MSESAPEEVLWDFMRGALRTRVLALVADLGVAEAIADGSRSVADLARELGADPDTLHRFLRALASDGLFAETDAGVFRNTQTSELLCDPSERAFAHLFGGVWHRAAGELDARTGTSTFARTYGSDFWAWLAEHPAERAAFDVAMAGGVDGSADRLAPVDWHGDETVVDVGGGNGSLLVELLRRQPGLRGVAFDLPETVRDETSFGDRIEFVAGSFFERVPEGNVYILSDILHDWDDDGATAILRTVRRAAKEDARLVLLERVVPAGNEPHGAKWLDLLMLALFAGRERSEAQWRALLTAGGFEPVSIQDGLIEARCR